MVRGETQYNKMSRFLKEIPMNLMENNALFERPDPPKEHAFRQAKQSFKTKAFQTKPLQSEKPLRNFGYVAKNGLGYDVGDRVVHTKCGEGTVASIVKGGKDYEITIEFDKIGTRKMFAGFAGLVKVL